VHGPHLNVTGSQTWPEQQFALVAQLRSHVPWQGGWPSRQRHAPVRQLAPNGQHSPVGQQARLKLQHTLLPGQTRSLGLHPFSGSHTPLLQLSMDGR
jgi:hypothetical protein